MNTSKFIDMNGIFHQCNSISSLPDISRWNIYKVINKNYMFSRFESLSSLSDLSNWKTADNSTKIGEIINNLLNF